MFLMIIFSLFIFSHIEEFDILQGDTQGLPDTISFLKSLSGLQSVVDSVKHGEKPQLRERAAAARLFNWEVFDFSDLCCLLLV